MKPSREDYVLPSAALCDTWRQCESIDLSHSSGAADLKATLSDVDMDSNASDQAADVTSFSSSLSSVPSDSHLDVISGSASGNEAMGEIMGVYDATHNGVLFFDFTNCGSDG